MAEAAGTQRHDGVRARTRATRGMQYFHGVVAVTFVGLALLHVPHPSPWLWLPYAAGAGLAILTLVPNLSILISRILAIAATALVFFFFSGFFMEVPKLESDWYQGQEGWSAVGLLLGAFTLIPVLSDFSCRCKAECRESHSHQMRYNGFFTAPDQARPPNH